MSSRFITRLVALCLFVIPSLASASRFDFNADGKDDIVWHDNATGSNGIWYMSGTSEVDGAILQSTSDGFQIAGAGDFDGDGDPDLLWFNPSTASVRIWKMNPLWHEVYDLPPAYTTAKVIAVADVDGNGIDDIVWRPSLIGDSLEIWFVEQNALSSVSKFDPPAAVVAVGDFNADGRADLFFQQSYSLSDPRYNYVWFMHGSTLLASHQLPTRADQLAPAGAADFDGDGRDEILWHDATNGMNALWTIDGGEVTSEKLLPSTTAGWSLASIGDLNGDSKADLFWRNLSSGENAAWLVDGTSVISRFDLPHVGPAFEVASPPPGIAAGLIIPPATVCSGTGNNVVYFAHGSVGQLDWRGDIDAAQGSSYGTFRAGSGELALLRASILNTRNVRTQFSASSRVVTAELQPSVRNHAAPRSTGEINVKAPCSWTAFSNSSFITITSGSSASGDSIVTYTVEANSGAARAGSITVAGQTFAVSQDAGRSTSAASTDFNGDGKADLVWRDVSTGQSEVWLLDGANTPATLSLPSMPNEFAAAAVADFDGDGDADVLWRDDRNGSNRMWIMNGSGMQSESDLPAVGAEFIVAGAGDLDNDGLPEIIWRNNVSGQQFVWFMDGAKLRTAESLPAALPGGYFSGQWRIVAVADFDNDHRADLLFRNPSKSDPNDPFGGSNYLWRMNGSAVAHSDALPREYAGMRFGGASDFNGDGSADLIWHDKASGRVEIWLLQGPVVQQKIALPNVPAPLDIVGLADANGDGSTDVIWRNGDTGENAVWLFDGTYLRSGAWLPSASTSRALAAPFPGSNPGRIVVADVFCPDSIGNIATTVEYPYGATLLWVVDGMQTSATNRATFSAKSLPYVDVRLTITSPRGVTSTLTKLVPISAAATITPGVGDLLSQGGDGSFSLTADCSWTASSTEPFVKVTSPLEGSGDAVVSYTVLPHEGFERSATIHIAGKRFAVRQSGTISSRPDHLANADNSADIFWRNESTREVALWYLYPQGYGDSIVNNTIPAQGVLLPSPPPNKIAVAVADFDGDADSDILWRGTDGTNLVWLTQSVKTPPPSNGRFWTFSVQQQVVLPSAPGGFHVAGVGDFDRDRNTDILWRNSNTGEVAVWLLRDGLNVSGAYLPTVSTAMQIVAVDDFNNDYKADIFFRDAAGTNALWLMDGVTIVRGVFLPEVTNGMGVVGAGDFDADGHADVVWQDPSTGAAAMWKVVDGNVAAGSFLSQAPSGMKIVGVGDVDGDRKGDLIWRDPVTGKNQVWRMDGGTLHLMHLLPDVPANLTLISPE